MKQCPVCKTNYTDDSLIYCLADGTTLFSNSRTSEKTEQFSAATNPIRVEIPQNSSPTVIAPPIMNNPAPQPVKKEGRAINMLIGLSVGFALTALLAIILISAWFIFGNKPNNTIAANNNPAKPSPTPDESANLRNKINDLEKKVKEQTKPTIPVLKNTSPSPAQTTKNTARVNSPGDGFLALRTQPSSETGDRILQIPHGSTVTVLSCLAKAPGKKARWCRVDYNGNLGWAYDGFLIY